MEEHGGWDSKGGGDEVWEESVGSYFFFTCS